MIPGDPSAAAYLKLINWSWLVLGSFDGPSMAVGDFTTVSSATTVTDGIAIANFGRNNFCVIQLQ